MSAVAGAVVGAVLGAAFIICVLKSCFVVKEKEVVVIERLGTPHNVLTAGIHFIVPFLDEPKVYDYRYTVTDKTGYSYAGYTPTTIKESSGNYRISLQNEMLDVPKQHVITRDNAKIALDAVLYYQILTGSNARTTVYSVTNLPFVLSQLLQAHMRNVAASLDVDQLIEDASALNVLTQLLNDAATRWGVRVTMVKIQGIDTGDLANDLGKKKTTDLTNRKKIIEAKSNKQSKVLQAEANRDGLIKTAEGEAQKKISNAQGKASAIINAARAEAEALQKVIPALQARGENPVQYYLNQKYVEVLRQGLVGPNTAVTFLPEATAALQVARELGFASIPGYAVEPKGSKAA